MKTQRKFFVANTRERGAGLFASRNFPRGEVLFIAKGKMIKTGPYDSSYAVGPRWLGLGKQKWLDILPSSPLYYVNHSCRPNAGIKGRVTFIALKTVRRGEEITFDYSITEEDLFWRMECRCMTKKCRQVIGPISSLSNKIFQSYLPHVPTYFQKVYRR